MSQPSDTPLTDEAERQHAVVAAEFGPMVCGDFARQLERELNQTKPFYDKWQNDSSLETWFPITAEELKQLRAELATAKAQIEKLRKFADHGIACTVWDSKKPCTCGLSKLLKEIKA